MKDNSTASGSAKESSMTAAEEREAVVRWLRERAIVHRSNWAVSVNPQLQALAKAIEAGAHIMEKSDGETANER